MIEVACVKAVSGVGLMFVSGYKAEAFEAIKEAGIGAGAVAEDLLEGFEEIVEFVELGEVIAEVVAKRAVVAGGGAAEGVEIEAVRGEEIKGAASKERVAVEEVEEFVVDFGRGEAVTVDEVGDFRFGEVLHENALTDVEGGLGGIRGDEVAGFGGGAENEFEVHPKIGI